MSNWMIQKKKNDDLIHYGVLGMKWGVRRYQNKDGSLTSAGRKRYSSAKKPYPIKDKPGNPDKLTYKQAKAIIKSQNFLTGEKMIEQEHKLNNDITNWDELAKKDKDFKRMDDAAFIGLESLFYMDLRDADQSSSDPANKWWFCFEDQTIGLPLVADLVIQGKSKEEIFTIFKASNIVSDTDKEYYEDPYFDIGEAGANSMDTYPYAKKRLNNFIDGCIKAKKDLDKNNNNFKP